MENLNLGFYSLKEVAEGFNVDRSAVSYWLNTGKLQVIKFGNAKLVTPNSVLDFIKKFPKYEAKVKKEFLEKVKADAGNISFN
ncbi:MAG TPA: helix-turn-helix domain-containing protein [Leptospiraceae bacterium]|nr:helix-turn-helix domain-containing protein [Leptospiraceae bacterium]